MHELIKEFNTDKTHLEFDTINQYDNGTTDEKNFYTYTVYLIDNKTNYPITGAVSINNFEDDSIQFVRNILSNHLRSRGL